MSYEYNKSISISGPYAIFSAVETAGEVNICFMVSLNKRYINYNNSDIRQNT